MTKASETGGGLTSQQPAGADYRPGAARHNARVFQQTLLVPKIIGVEGANFVVDAARDQIMAPSAVLRELIFTDADAVLGHDDALDAIVALHVALSGTEAPKASVEPALAPDAVNMALTAWLDGILRAGALPFEALDRLGRMQRIAHVTDPRLARGRPLFNHARTHVPTGANLSLRRHFRPFLADHGILPHHDRSDGNSRWRRFPQLPEARRRFAEVHPTARPFESPAQVWSRSEPVKTGGGIASVDPERETLQNILHAWNAAIGPNRRMTVMGLFKLAGAGDRDDEFPDTDGDGSDRVLRGSTEAKALLDALQATVSAQNRAGLTTRGLGRYLGGVNGRIVDGLSISIFTSTRNAAEYMLQQSVDIADF